MNNIKSLRIAAVSALLLICSGMFAQTKGNGTVVDKDGFPIAGVSVKAGSTTVITNAEGQFALDPSATLIIEKEGYLPKSVTAADKMTVVLEEDENNKLINLRYDIQKKFGMTAAVSTIYAADIEDEFNGNIYSTIAGKAAGLTAITKNGVPTDEVDLSWNRADKNYRIYVRGIHSPNMNQREVPVYVDGIKSQLIGLMPSEIETISILKDAAALSMFGTNGGDGVIYITTKRGHEGHNKVNVDFQHGYQQIGWTPDFIDSYTYASLYNEARYNDGQAPFYTDEQLNAYKSGKGDANYDLLYPNVNWYEETLKKLAPMTTASATFSGGNKIAKYFAMIGYQDIEGFYDGTDKSRDYNSNISDRRYNFRVNLDIDLGDIFYLNGGVSGMITDDYDSSVGNLSVWQNMHLIPANAMPANTPKGYGASAQFQNANPIANVLEKGYKHLHNRNLNAYTTFGQKLDGILEGLYLEETVHIDNNHQFSDVKSKNFQTFAPKLVNGTLDYTSYGQEFNNFSYTSSGGLYDTIKNRIQFEATANWARTFGTNSVNASVTFHTDKFTADGKQSMPLITRGFHGRFGYSADNKFFAEFDWSYSGESWYNPECNTGWFPALSLAYVFVDNNSLDANVNYFKVRASSGLTGFSDYFTSESTRFMWRKYYQFYTVTRRFRWSGNGSKQACYESVDANLNASWEKHWMNNLGFDTRFFGNRLSATVDLFFEDNYDLLVAPNVAGYFGVNYDTNMNEGEIYNMGAELALGWNDQIGDFTYGINGNFSFTRNRVINLNQPTQLYEYQSNVGIKIGTPMVYVADGLYKTDAEAAAANSLIGDVKAGDIKYIDTNKDGQIDANDMTYDNGLFSSIPEISYGLNIHLGYKAFDFDLDGYGFANRSVNTYNYQIYAFNGGYNNVSSVALDRWAYNPEKGIDTRETATYPRLTLGSNSSNSEASTFWYKNGGIFRISNISLGYTFNRNSLAKAGIDKARVYVAVANPIAFYSTYEDPETLGSWPINRIYKVGFNFNF